MKPHSVIHLMCAMLFVITGSYCQSAISAVTLQLQIGTHNSSAQADAKIPPDSNAVLDVTLAEDFISVKSDQSTTIYDFKTRHRYMLNDTNKSYMEFSLYDVIGFRTMEFKNREVLQGAMAAAKITSVSTSTVDGEHLFSLLSKSPAKIDGGDSGDDPVFSNNNRVMAKWNKQGYKVSTKDAVHFAKLLRYIMGGHPAILNKLAAGSLIPNKLTFVFTESLWTSNRSITVSSLQQSNKNSFDISAYTLRTSDPSADGVDDLLDRVTHQTPEAIEKAQARIRESADRALQEGYTFDAMLGLTEWTLMTGKSIPPFSQDQLLKIRNDPSIRKWMSMLGAKSKQDFSATITTFLELRSQAPTKSYVLKIFEANNRIRLGDSAVAKKLFMEVLQENMFVAGVYKDLGDLFMMQYDTPRAWRCWNEGRRIAPQLKLLQTVAQFEQSLASQYPEYF